ncbi:Pyrophosphate--fructose 6-phosphate 1-phosphotransferase [Rosistilla carotiformis]|uniref:ATP-dependent 6-phosphofructokinase n=1 Tax=Rosistilla carotiformis TaxID=2528017 RepID=A0A518JS44_9BACT|nr:ATP-dependent 6-phosphofructokinase [Rosistilla carotiformis]QDV68345.1 Pyrophosphate--fructose 6-phosphate 1-phosphotransferase [Rosistilla carotiformis]
MYCKDDFHVERLGECRFDSPLLPLLDYRQHSVNYVEESDRILAENTASSVAHLRETTSELFGLEPAGARRKIFFNPPHTRAGIVTCGGLCPGLNNVIRSLTNELTCRYGIAQVLGFSNGYQGLVERCNRPTVELTPHCVADIHEHGGTILGSSRGDQRPEEIVDYLEKLEIDILFVIGGDGTIRGSMAIADEIAKRDRKIGVIGIPKTIDNDIMFADQSFGFQTALSQGTEAIRAAHVEACGAPNGVGLVKLMGRHSGFIACYASLAVNDANFVLIPEVPFSLEGAHGLLACLKRRLDDAGHAVIVVAEGAGQHLMQSSGKTDASGNSRLGDVGVWLKQQIESHFTSQGKELNLKYIDPSYVIRSVPANPYDSVFCSRLAHNAVHAAMSGRTRMVVSRWHTKFVNVPMSLAIRQRNCVDPNGDLWMTVLESTGQPPRFE